MVEHNSHLFPVADNATLWRYMDFTKFMSILATNSVWFASASYMDDPYEGVMPTTSKQLLRQMIDNLTGERINDEVKRIVYDGVNNAYDDSRGSAYLSCWHNNDYESAAMWKLYSASNDCIAIKTTFADIRQAFSKTDKRLIATHVRYLDYDREHMKNLNMLSPLAYKRKSFEHENEVRLIWYKPIKASTSKRSREAAIDKIPIGVYIDVDVQALIKKIYVSPKAGLWFHDLVKSVCQKYALDCIPERSTMYDKVL